MNCAERLANSIVEAQEVRNTFWSDNLAEAVAEVRTAKDEEWEPVCSSKDSSHSNGMKDQQEDHEHLIEDLKLEHTESLYEHTERHAEELQQLTKKHGLEARELEMRRAQAAKEVKKLKERLSEMEAENTAVEKNLGYVAGERDAWFKAFATVQGLSPPQAITSLVPSQSDEHPYCIQEDDDATNEPEDIGTTDTVAANKDTIENHPATDAIPLHSHHSPILPNEIPS